LQDTPTPRKRYDRGVARWEGKTKRWRAHGNSKASPPTACPRGPRPTEGT
jgi:hypothetical protein